MVVVVALFAAISYDEEGIRYVMRQYFERIHLIWVQYGTPSRVSSRLAVTVVLSSRNFRLAWCPPPVSSPMAVDNVVNPQSHLW